MRNVEYLRLTADEMLSSLQADDAMARKIAFKAQQMNNIPEIADEMLSGLQTTPALRHRILVSAERIQRKGAASVQSAHTMRRGFVPTVAFSLLLVVLVTAGMFSGGIFGRSQENLLLNDATMVYSSEAAQKGTSEYRSLFAGSEENPPLLVVNGRYYRMLEQPDMVPSALMDSAVTQVQTVVEDFSQAGTLGVASNVAASGSKIFAIDGISIKTVLAAEVNGSPRLFQRVSVQDNALLGEESFEDTIDVLDQVSALELTGVGVISDEAKANELIYMLTEGDFTVWQGTESREAEGALTIYLKNGLSLQLHVSGDTLGACGVWACPEFFTAFADAMK